MSAMKYNDREDYILKYLEGELSDADQQAFEQSMREASDDTGMYELYKEMYQDFENPIRTRPSGRLRQNFEAMLSESTELSEPKDDVLEEPKKKEEEKAPTKEFRIPRLLMSIAAVGTVLIALGVLIGISLSNNKIISGQDQQIAELRSTMNDLLQEQSTTTRIKAVNMTKQMETVDPEMIDVLIRTMNSDASDNVRLAAVEVLSKYANNKQVKNAFIAGLIDQQDPMVQMTLINLLSEMNEEKAVENLNKLIEDETTLKFVKDEAEIGKLKLTTI